MEWMVSKYRNIVMIGEIVRAISGEVRGEIRIWKKWWRKELGESTKRPITVNESRIQDRNILQINRMAL